MPRGGAEGQEPEPGEIDNLMESMKSFGMSEPMEDDTTEHSFDKMSEMFK